ncbi:phage head closure protein [Thermoactinomyces sp. CICC 10521]|uniref:phage head closure protein n=1 Tax=Thermoactinomyces sp. CICC 10521 TaxID=2767426 RepID=UPI0018DC763E|nr:phage head closure protein [Thermoactinomyces sp. CICC 10521]MBH8605992.1 phage head closure protein [Thermoactinomyces sp. CICC 10521]
MRISDLRHRITIQQKTTTRDAEGNVRESWNDVATVWAAFEPMTSRWREFLQAAAINAESYVRFRIRYRSDVTSAMRILYAGRQFDIVETIDLNGRHQKTHIFAKEVSSGG